jgi:hypothetical protein
MRVIVDSVGASAMATFDFEALQAMQAVYDDVVDKVSKDSRYKSSPTVRETIAKSIFEVANDRQVDAKQIEQYALAKALTALAGMTA